MQTRKILTIINDCHLLAKRSGGTTLQSTQELLHWQLDQFQALLNCADGTDLLINGDLFDAAQPTPQVDLSGNRPQNAFFSVFEQLAVWCNTNPDSRLILSAGNHDLPRNDQLPSAFGTLCALLNHTQLNVVVVNGANYTDHNRRICIVPHYANQELFDAALQEASAHGYTTFVHANYDNHFAQQSDHSLNVSREVASQFKQLVFGHEHHARQFDNVYIVGNQIPTSIADCLDNNTHKQYAQLDYARGEITLHNFIALNDIFTQVDWTSEALPEKLFIRVTGNVEPTDAPKAVAKIAQWRRQSKAFVLTNALQITAPDTQKVTQDVQSDTFDVWSEIEKHIPEHLKTFAQEVRNRD